MFMGMPKRATAAFSLIKHLRRINCVPADRALAKPADCPVGEFPSRHNVKQTPLTRWTFPHLTAARILPRKFGHRGPFFGRR
jgi:hypothetical protein